MRVLVIIFGKIAIRLLQLFGKNGSALPGLIAEKVYPGLLKKQLDQLEGGVVIVTGTNGKTTTTKSLVFLLQQCGLKVLTNPTGSNFTRGIYATLIKHSSIGGALDYDIAVLELDEAYSRIFADQYPPRGVLALNIMRDQLDRYGEIDATARMIGDTVAQATEVVVLNIDDRRIRELAARTDKQTLYFGVADELASHLPTEDEFEGISIHGPKKRTKHARKKEKHAPKNSVTLADFKHGSAGFRIHNKTYRTHLSIAGVHNAFNATAALTMAMHLCPEMEPQFIVPAMKEIPAAFGRGEVLHIGETSIVLALVKNPSGFRQSIQSYDSNEYGTMGFVINDEFADGRDVSWLWDVEFKGLSKTNRKYTAGIRASDMALRLKYDGLKSTQCDSYTALIDTILEEKSDQALIYCTYTAMLALRKEIATRTEVGGMW